MLKTTERCSRAQAIALSGMASPGLMIFVYTREGGRLLTEQRSRQQIGRESDRRGENQAGVGAAPVQSERDHHQQAEVGREAGGDEGIERAQEHGRRDADREDQQRPLHDEGPTDSLGDDSSPTRVE